ncbi:increased DNA methylation 1-like [Pistacia vera]|uniref:increased DNA methylation 1-like n=1 Tax=Pistacia vera TaxID=55513 RepID=UPI00126389FB|nr:increased DNA methylation 1-like [Pistacia vera]
MNTANPSIPEAILYWYEHGIEIKRSGKNKDTLEEVRNYLKSAGWTFWYKTKGLREELRYTSPTGRNYLSLRMACKGYMEERGLVVEDIIAARNKKLNLASQSLDGPPPPLHSNGNDAIDGKTLLSDSNKVNSRSVAISWLIDNNLVLPKSKAHYLGVNGPLAKGQIDRDGIKCDCCNQVFTLSKFEAHAGSKKHRPAANIFLDDGKSLSDCQRQMFENNEIRRFEKKQHNAIENDKLCFEKKQHKAMENDKLCSVCRSEGELIFCSNCPSSFHKRCLGLKDIANGNWFCPSCSCGICSKRKFEENTGHSHSKGEKIICICDQCQHNFHMGCLRKSRGTVKSKNSQNKWFCSDRCERVSYHLHQLLGRLFPLGRDGLTCRMLKPGYQNPSDSDKMGSLMENQQKLIVALNVMHECFEPIKEASTGRDLFEEVIMNRGSDLKRLNFRGFYTMVSERNEEVISVANFRVSGKVAEIPIVATRLQYRKNGVERLVLPAIPDNLNMWIGKFEFSKMTDSGKLQYLNYAFLDFQDAIMCQKWLMKTSPVKFLSV